MEARSIQQVMDDLACKIELEVRMGTCHPVERVIEGRVLSVDRETGQITFELDSDLPAELLLSEGYTFHLVQG